MHITLYITIFSPPASPHITKTYCTDTAWAEKKRLKICSAHVIYQFHSQNFNNDSIPYLYSIVMTDAEAGGGGGGGGRRWFHRDIIYKIVGVKTTKISQNPLPLYTDRSVSTNDRIWGGAYISHENSMVIFLSSEWIFPAPREPFISRGTEGDSIYKEGDSLLAKREIYKLLPMSEN